MRGSPKTQALLVAGLSIAGLGLAQWGRGHMVLATASAGVAALCLAMASFFWWKHRA